MRALRIKKDKNGDADARYIFLGWNEIDWTGPKEKQHTYMCELNIAKISNCIFSPKICFYTAEKVEGEGEFAYLQASI